MPMHFIAPQPPITCPPTPLPPPPTPPMSYLPLPCADLSIITLQTYKNSTFVLLVYNVLFSISDNLQTGCIHFLWWSMVWVRDIATRGQRYIRATACHSRIDGNSNSAHRPHQSANFSLFFPSFDLLSLALSPSVLRSNIPSSSPPQLSLFLTKSILVTSVCIHLQWLSFKIGVSAY